MKAVLGFVFLLSTASFVDAANILFYQVFGSPSHALGAFMYLNALEERGHRVTFISSFDRPKHPVTKHEHIVVPETQALLGKVLSTLNVFQNRVDGGIMKPITILNDMSPAVCQEVLKSPQMADIIKGKRKFDLLIFDPLSNECSLGIAHIYKIPYIYFNTAGIYSWNSPPFGMGSTVPYKLSVIIPRANNVTKFTHRLLHTIGENLFDWYRRWVVLPSLENMWRDIGVAVPSFEEMEREASLMFLNTHVSVEPPVSYTNNVIEVGGIHMIPSQPLPKDLADAAEKSGDAGFIIFGLGTVANVKDMDQSYFKLFVEAFGKIPQTVFWKWEAVGTSWESPVPIPSNVKLVKWLPQQDLLGHPKCKAFITHGGKLSTIEAIHFGVPMLVIPFFADQDMHAELAVERGYGLSIDIQDVTAEKLSATVQELVQNKKYRERAQHQSRILNDQPQKPIDVAVYWTEYVLRHKGAPHLRPYARHMYWWQYHLVDVWATIAGVFLGIVLVIRFAIKLCFGSKKTVQKGKRQKRD